MTTKEKIAPMTTTELLDLDAKIGKRLDGWKAAKCSHPAARSVLHVRKVVRAELERRHAAAE